MEKYKVAKKAAKRAVSEARGRAYEDLYQRLNTKEGERDISPERPGRGNRRIAAASCPQGRPRFSDQDWQKRTKWREGCLGSISSAAHQRRHSPSRWRMSQPGAAARASS